MARLIYSESALADLERDIDFYAEADPALAERVLFLIQEAVHTLEPDPGNPAPEGSGISVRRDPTFQLTI